MAQHAPPAAPSPDDMHWGISYLREDIQDLRHDMRAMQARIDSRFSVVMMAMVGLHGVTVGAIVAFLQYTGR